jgi:hypothetical protein
MELLDNNHKFQSNQAMEGHTLRIACDVPHSMARFKDLSALKSLLERNGRSLNDYLVSSENRKGVHVICDGEIDSEYCFCMDDIPGPSFRANSKSIPSDLKGLVIPNGWKIVGAWSELLYTVQAKADSEGMKYQFCLVDENGNEQEPGVWSPDLKEALKAVTEKDTKGLSFKLLLGCHYHNPQKKIMAFVRNEYESGKYDANVGVKRLVEQWMELNPEQWMELNPEPNEHYEIDLNCDPEDLFYNEVRD